MKLPKTIILAAFVLTGLGLTHAADLAGKWTAEFDSPIGVQKYAYEFKVEGEKITGKATYDHSMGKGDSELKEIKLSGDALSFNEPLHLNEMDIIVSYTGKITGDSIKLTRQVGDFATEELVAKRVKAPEVKPEAKPVPAK